MPLFIYSIPSFTVLDLFNRLINIVVVVVVALPSLLLYKWVNLFIYSKYAFKRVYLTPGGVRLPLPVLRQFDR